MSELLLRRRNLLLRKQEELNIRAVCFEADGEQTVSITMVGTAPTITMQYSYDGVTWNAWDLTPLPFGGSTKVYVRGVHNERFGADASNYNKITFSTDAFVYVSGIVESLLDGENEVLKYSIPNTFGCLFRDQIALREADRLRFEAMSISEACYNSMFNNCSNLLSTPELLATDFSANSYRGMFMNCKSLIKGPSILPATIIRDWSYSYMFKGCTSLVNAPELPAETMSRSCYYQMFYGCTSLKTIRCRAKVTANSATTYWLYGVSPSGTFYGHSEYGWYSGVSGIPSGWEFVELAD